MFHILPQNFERVSDRLSYKIWLESGMPEPGEAEVAQLENELSSPLTPLPRNPNLERRLKVIHATMQSCVYLSDLDLDEVGVLTKQVEIDVRKIREELHRGGKLARLIRQMLCQIEGGLTLVNLNIANYLLQKLSREI